jgi:hypothetical protein
MKTLVLAAAAALALAAASNAEARPLGGSLIAGATGGAAGAASATAGGGGSCLPWKCNGTRLTGIARPTLEAKRPVVNAVTLPSGETVDLR